MDKRWRAALAHLSSALALAGCVDYQVTQYGGTNFVTFEHPFTDKAVAEVRAEAKKRCAATRKLAVQTQRTCTLTKCSTVFQCADESSVREYGDQADVVK